jgi:hypothetical protein
VLADQPPDAEIQVILDNHSRTNETMIGWRSSEGSVRFHYTPTSISWLNQIEIVFGLLQRKTPNGEASKPGIGCVTLLKPSSEDTTKAPGRSAGASATSMGSQLRNTVVRLRDEH